MAGLEVLFSSAAPAISCPQDALVCFLHWEVVTNGYYGLGTGDQVRCGAGLGGGESEIRGSEAQRPRLTLPSQGPRLLTPHFSASGVGANAGTACV